MDRGGRNRRGPLGRANHRRLPLPFIIAGIVLAIALAAGAILLVPMDVSPRDFDQ